MHRILLIEKDRHVIATVTGAAREAGFRLDTVETLRDAQRCASQHAPDVVLVDLTLLDENGAAMLTPICQPRHCKVVVLTDEACVETAVAAMKRGAHDFLVKPLGAGKLQRILSDVATLLGIPAEDGDARPRGGVVDSELLGESPAILEVKKIIARVAPTDATVFITGETGTGKELVAAEIHARSGRNTKPLIAVNCSALSPNLLESEIFGHERGSFTGANRRHDGYFERADKGTMFLDEVTEMPIELQPKLLRLLETGTFVRVGGDVESKVDVRIIAASNRDPLAAVHDGKLREDLLYRLSVFPITLPPLRDRGDDVILLAESFLADLNAAEGTTKSLAPACRDALKAHPWPGNIRELKNTIRRAFILADEAIGAEVLFPARAVEDVVTGLHLKIPLGAPLADAEKRVILSTLDHCGGHRRKTAELLGISPKTLYNRLVEYRVVQPAR